MKRQDVVLSALDRAGSSKRIFRVYPQPGLHAGRPLYLDDNHLSGAGANLVLPEFEPIFADHGLPAAAAEATGALAV